MVDQWLVFVADRPGEQAFKMVVCPNWVRLKLPRRGSWTPVQAAMKLQDRVWFFVQGRGIEKLCEIVGPFSDNNPHPAYPDVSHSFQWPVRVIASFPRIDSAAFGTTLFRVANGSADIPCDSQGRFTQNTYCHRLPLAVASALAALASSMKGGEHIDVRFPTLAAAVTG